MKLLPLEVFHSSLGDSTNGGISSKEHIIYLVDEKHGRDMSARKIDPAAIFDMEDCGGGYIRLIPRHQNPKLAGPMFGGNIATLARHACDGVTHKLEGKFLHIHDRFETWELNDLLSR